MSDMTPEEFELAWQLEHPEGEIVHVRVDEDGNIVSVDEDPYGSSSDDDND